MAVVALFHAVGGLQPVILTWADHLRGLGHHVIAPDLFDGATADSLSEGMALMAAIGWDTICARAAAALEPAPADTALMGFSMGAGVVGDLWADRPEASAIFLLHGLPPAPQTARQGTKVQVHHAIGDSFVDAAALARFDLSVADLALDVERFEYPDAGHFYIDDTLPDFEPQAAELTWQRVTDALTKL